MKKIYFTLLLLPNILLAQQLKNYFIGYSSIYGAPIGKIRGDVSNHITGQQIFIGHNLQNDPQEWVHTLSAENLRFGFSHIDMNKVQQNLSGRTYSFGDAYAATASVDFRLAKFGKVNVHFSPTIGVAYISTNVYTDPDSYIFGSHINTMFEAGLGLQYQFMPDYALTTKVSFLHFSNGGMQLPNAGVNALIATFGIQRNLNFDSVQSKPSKTEKPVKKHAVDLTVGFGQRGKYKIKEAFYRATISPAYSYFISNVIGLKASIDAVYYDQVFNPAVYDDSVPYWGKSYDHWRIGASLGTEIKMNKVSFNASFGSYLYFKSPYNQKTYWKAGLRYYITPKIGVDGTMFAHQFQADIISFGTFIRL